VTQDGISRLPFRRHETNGQSSRPRRTAPRPTPPRLRPRRRDGEFWASPETRAFGELLIDLEEDKAARAAVFGLLREIEPR
jgi:hypothetical protein